MTKKDPALDSPIFKAAVEEFTARGYKNASLRTIAEKAGVTTGAIYTRYKGKEELFNSLVSETADNFFALYEDMRKEFENLSQDEKLKYLLMGNNNTSDDELDGMIDLLYASYDELKLLMLCSGGTAYESFMDQLIDKEVKIIMSYIDGVKHISDKEKDMYKMNAHIIITAYFNGLIEIFRHNLSEEDADLYLRNVEEFYSVGWKHFFNKLKDK